MRFLGELDAVICVLFWADAVREVLFLLAADTRAAFFAEFSSICRFLARKRLNKDESELLLSLLLLFSFWFCIFVLAVFVLE